MEKKVGFIMLALLLLGATALFASEPVRGKNIFKTIASIEGRGSLNLVTTPSEVVYTFKSEKEIHPKAWPATYVPRTLTNAATRVVSSAYDIFLLPWYAAAIDDATPVTRHFDMPDYAWKKE